MSPPSLLLPLLLVLCFIFPVTAAPTYSDPFSGGNNLPIIDLGYVRQQAALYNSTTDYYVYKNIRFAAPPLGELRFRRPSPPLPEHGVQDGEHNHSTACAQTPTKYANLTGGEDCLFLDVYVPRVINHDEPVPVLAWWYGGGYVSGSKEDSGTPVGLFEQAPGSFIFVAANYRLGAYGFSAPPDDDVDPNIGLHDARMAMDWIGEHISKFGGNPNNVTAMGLSAGGGAILHTIVSNGGGGRKLPFQQAILQSPGWMPEASPNGRIPIWKAFLSKTGCPDAACLRKAPTGVLHKANADTIRELDAGDLGPTSGFYPVVDGSYIPDTVPRLLDQGRFHKEVRSVISSSSRWEGANYVPPNLEQLGFARFLVLQFSSNPEIIKKIEEEYLADYSAGSLFDRAADFVGDFAFNCNGFWLSKAFASPGHHSRRYIFNLAVGHGQDLPYLFWKGGAHQDRVYYPDFAPEHQRLVVDFAINGGQALTHWPEWTPEHALSLWLNATGFAVGKDYYASETNVERCEFFMNEIIGHG